MRVTSGTHTFTNENGKLIIKTTTNEESKAGNTSLGALKTLLATMLVLVKGRWASSIGEGDYEIGTDLERGKMYGMGWTLVIKSFLDRDERKKGEDLKNVASIDMKYQCVVRE